MVAAPGDVPGEEEEVEEDWEEYEEVPAEPAESLYEVDEPENGIAYQEQFLEEEEEVWPEENALVEEEALEEEEDENTVDEDQPDVQEHLRESVEGSFRVKRLLERDDTLDAAGASKRQKLSCNDGPGPVEQARIKHILKKWGCEKDSMALNVLENCSPGELHNLLVSNFKPDKANLQKSPSEQAMLHTVRARERLGPGGGKLDAVQTFRHRWELDMNGEKLLRKLNHKDLRHLLQTFDGTQTLEEVAEEAAQTLPQEGVAAGAAPDWPGVKTVGRFQRLELIDPLADALIFGDANLSFALKLARHRKGLGHVGRVIATTFENIETLRERYKEIDETIKSLEDLYAEVWHGVDCTRIAVDPKFEGLENTFGAVYYNFPHAGAVRGFFDGHPLVNWRHENLMRLLFRALRSFVKPGGSVKVASNSSAVGVRYSYIIDGAAQNEFVHVETIPFLDWSLRRYMRSYGDRRDVYKRPEDGQVYNVQRAESDMVYAFCYAPSGETLPKQQIRLPPAFSQIVACQDGPFKGLPPAAREKLAGELFARFKAEVTGTHIG